MIGHDLGGRYEILTRIGGGGMALVYKAHDILLNRNVAVKVLRQQFVHDEEFIRRFRREAQSAASLSHPNIVSVYDVGQEDDTHYIVMEYIEGNNLNEVIQERAPLQADEAVRVAMQICDALDHAHHNHIIHRDIKPHNILIGKNGRVKVTDFGIARAVTSSTITQTGSVIGSVHYFSPEHAKGVSTGEKSDLYSLGIVLYQMLTGKLPFLGESPISVALKHLQEEFEEPRIVNPHIPQSVENVILRAMRKNPSERYSSAREMLQDLDTCLKSERLNEPKASFIMSNDLDETRVMPAIRDFKPSAVPSGVQSERLDAAASSNHRDAERKEKDITSKPKGWKRPTTIVAITLVVLALIIWGFNSILGKLDVAEVSVPYVVGSQEDEARLKLEELGLKVEEPVTREYNSEVPAGIVYDQSKANMRVKQGSFIQLSVSKGAELSTMKDYKGRTLQYAQDELAALGVNVKDQIKPQEVFSDEETGTIINQTPAADEEFDPATEQFTFMVSKGSQTIPMPNLIGKTIAEAKDIINANGLKLADEDILYEPDYVQTKGLVIDQDQYKPKDLVPIGSKISIRVSSGPPDDAREHTFNVVISPAEAGKTSEVRIVYSDARGKDIEWDRRQITTTQTFQVKVILAPSSSAKITVYRDNQFVTLETVDYDKVIQGEGPSTITVPGQEPTPPPSEEPTQAEVEEGNNNGTNIDEGSGPTDEQQQ